MQITITMLKVEEMFQNAKAAGLVREYEKFGTMRLRPAAAGEAIITVINGQEETSNTAKEGDWVVQGIAGEQYIISAEKFQARYEKIRDLEDGYVECKPLGHCFAFQYNGPVFFFTASWGERMVCEPGDYIASTVAEGTECYRIERSVFPQTYKEV